MDNTETYIKMCEKARKIQDEWKPTDGDFCWHGNEGEECYGNWEFPAEKRVVFINAITPQDWWYNWLWLPTQDRLQEMVFGISGDVQGQVWKLYTFATVNRATFPNVKSMEQLWLAFVMKEKYNKTWDGISWSGG